MKRKRLRCIVNPNHKPSRRLKFIVQMIFLMMLMLLVSIAIRANFYTQFVIWGLFVYIIAKEFLDFWREETAQDRNSQLRREIMAKIKKIRSDIESTV